MHLLAAHLSQGTQENTCDSTCLNGNKTPLRCLKGKCYSENIGSGGSGYGGKGSFEVSNKIGGFLVHFYAAGADMKPEPFQ